MNLLKNLIISCMHFPMSLKHFNKSNYFVKYSSILTNIIFLHIRCGGSHTENIHFTFTFSKTVALYLFVRSFDQSQGKISTIC